MFHLEDATVDTELSVAHTAPEMFHLENATFHVEAEIAHMIDAISHIETPHHVKML